jgi:membrane-bound lytic murein transglycosylase
MYDVKEVVVTKKDKKLNIKDEKKIKETEKEYKEALAYIKDLVSPAFMKIQPNNIKINNTFAKTFFVYAYPSFLE